MIFWKWSILFCAYKIVKALTSPCKSHFRLKRRRKKLVFQKNSWDLKGKKNGCIFKSNLMLYVRNKHRAKGHRGVWAPITSGSASEISFLRKAIPRVFYELLYIFPDSYRSSCLIRFLCLIRYILFLFLNFSFSS